MGLSQTQARRMNREISEATRFQDAEELRVAVELGDYPDRELVEFGRAFERFADGASVRPIRKF